MRLEIHVRPNAAQTVVGGTYDGALLVRVTERAERGRATDAALGAVADALAIPRSAVVLIRGATSHRKLIEVSVPEPKQQPVNKRILRLRGDGDEPEERQVGN